MIAELLDELRGSMSENALARQVGISRRMLSMLYTRERSLGARTILRLLRCYPEKLERIMGVFRPGMSTIGLIIALKCQMEVNRLLTRKVLLIAWLSI